MCWHESLRWTEKVSEFRLCLFGVNLSHPVCGFCLLMFGWSWQDFCIHNTFLFVSQQVNLRGPPLLASAQIKSEAEFCGFSCGCTWTRHTQTDTQSLNKKKLNYWAQKMFPVKGSGCKPKSADDLPVVQAATERSKWIIHHFCCAEKK